MNDKKNYRDYIYGNYADTLQDVLITGNLDKERNMICKYFKKNYLPYFPEDKNCKVLDLGCGLGNYLYAIQKYGYQNVIGVDASASVVAFCKKEGLKCIQANAKEFLQKNDNSYDVILFNDVIEHLTKDELFEVLFLLRKSLKSGGRVFIKTVNLSNPITGVTGRYLDLTHEIGFTELTMRQVLLAVSFKKFKIIGADIYVSPVPFIYILKLCAKINNVIWYLFNCLYGRTSIKIFEKNIIAIAYKE